MADNILKLRVESSDYDAKLASAAKGIRHLADVAHKGAGDLTGLEKSELDYIRALGEMETKSRSASGQVRELESTYKELKVIYDQLNEVEKADEGGKALAASLETLKQRAQDAKSQLDAAGKSLQDNESIGKENSSMLEQLANKFTVNIDAIKLFNIGLQAAEGALNVAKDAFFASEATVDEWGRIVDSSKSLYEGFLTALNTGDISGYLSRIDSIVQAARAAYNELDRLGTMKTIQAPQMSAQQTENERMRMMIQTGRYIAPVDGRRASMQNGQLLTPDQIKRIEQQLQGGMQKVVTLVGNEVAQTGRAIDAVYHRQAQELGMSLKEFRKGTSSMAEFDKRMAGYEQYQKWREQHTTIDMQSGREIVARGNPFEQFAKWGTFRVDGQRYNDLVRLIQQRDQQAGQAYSMQSQAYRTMNRAEGVTVRQIMGGSGGGGTTTRTAATPKTEEQQNADRIAELVKQYQDLATAAKTADDAQKAGITERMSKIQGEINSLEARNSELKKFADEARQVQFPVGSLPQLNEQLKTLQTEQAKALDAKQWQDYQRQIEQTQYQIDALKGKWKDGLQATFKLNIKQQGSTDINTAKPDDIAVTFKADDADVLAKIRDIEGITIDDKTMSVTANTAEAYNKVQELLKGVDGKTVIFTVTVQPKMETGISITNDEGMSAYIASIKQQLETADYGTSLYKGLSAQLSDMTTLQNLVGESLKAGLGTAMFDAADATGKDFWTRAMEGGVENIDWKPIIDKINEKLKEMNMDPIAINFETGGVKNQANDMAKDWKSAASAIQSVGQAMSQIEDPAAKVMGTIAQAIATIALTFAESLNGTFTPWDWIAGAAAGTATMISTIAAIKSATKGGFAEGGIVPGNSYSGDNLRTSDYGINSGELILNRAQQNNIASQLETGNIQDNVSEAYVRGDTIYLSLTNYMKRTGKRLVL